MVMKRQRTRFHISGFSLLHIRCHWNFQLGIYHVTNGFYPFLVNVALVYVHDHVPCLSCSRQWKRVKVIPYAHLVRISICLFKFQHLTIALTITTRRQGVHRRHVCAMGSLKHYCNPGQSYSPSTAHCFKILWESVTHLVTRCIFA